MGDDVCVLQKKNGVRYETTPLFTSKKTYTPLGNKSKKNFFVEYQQSHVRAHLPNSPYRLHMPEGAASTTVLEGEWPAMARCNAIFDDLTEAQFRGLRELALKKLKGKASS